jgi:hypothetical protein
VLVLVAVSDGWKYRFYITVECSGWRIMLMGHQQDSHGLTDGVTGALLHVAAGIEELVMVGAGDASDDN